VFWDVTLSPWVIGNRRFEKCIFKTSVNTQDHIRWTEMFEIISKRTQIKSGYN